MRGQPQRANGRGRAGWAAALAALLAAAAAGWARPAPAAEAANVILFIGDGMGFGQIEAGACYVGAPLCFENWTTRGEATTRSANAAITDSAASATAMATGHKVNNGVLSVARPGDGEEYETVLEYLQRHGKRTGLATSSYLTDATPAAFAAHEESRGYLAAIAADYLERARPEVLLGGGGNGLRPADAARAGYTVVTNRAELLALDPAAVTRVAGLFGSGPLPYEGDERNGLPHLTDLVAVALDVLSRETNGFFLMAEGGRIDHACHATNIAWCVREVAEFDRAVQTAVAWASNRSDTLILVTADHETGGLRVSQDNGPGQEPDVFWGSGNHTASNVGVYAWGPGAEAVAGLLDNTDVYRVLLWSQPLVLQAVAIGPAGEGEVFSRWDARPGATCLLEAVQSAGQTNWTPLLAATADTHVLTFVDTNPPAASARFYRLRTQR